MVLLRRNASCVLLLTVLTMGTVLMLSSSVLGWNLVVEKDFSGTNGEPPDEAEWDVTLVDPRNSITIDNDQLKVQAVTSNWVRALSNWSFEANNFTFLVDAYPVSGSGGPIIVGTKTNSSGEIRTISLACYAPGWGWHAYRYPDGVSRTVISNSNNLEYGKWYTINITFNWDRFNVTVTQHGTGRVMWSVNNLLTDPHEGENHIYMAASAAVTYYDNLRIYDLDAPPNLPPVWGPVPTLHAVEDVPYTYDFSGNVSDPDGPLEDLTITTVSPYVNGTDDLAVTFLFPNGVTEASVPLVLGDGHRQAVLDVNFTVTPVNDPPEVSSPPVLEATEDVPFSYNLSAYVSDIDNETRDLSLVVDDRYVAAEGLTVFATFPEGVTEYEVQLGLTDGLATIWFDQRFTVTPVDDPPVVAPLGTFTAIEDQVSVLNLTPFLSDVDTPVADLSVIVRSARCDVYGQELHFHYAVGGVNETLLVQVTDGRTLVDAYVEVEVEERNDAPIVHPIPPLAFTEDQAGTLDLTEFIEDEDTEYEDMTLTCDHAAIVDITGLAMTLNFTTWVPEFTVFFNVSDGFLRTEGQFLVQVEEVNDPPMITGLGGLTEPVEIELDEGTSGEWPVVVVDEDDHNFRFSISTSWSGVTVTTDGVVRVEALKGDVGEYEATLMVEDPAKASDTMTFLVRVLNVNDPPSAVVIIRPNNHTIVEQGQNVTFSVSVDDPDIMFGQVLTVTWSSNISGPFNTLTTVHELSFVKDDLPVGVHRITVRASDGEHVREAWSVLEVVEPYVPPPPKPDEPFYHTPSGIGLIVLVVVLAVVAVAMLLVTRSRRGMEEPEEEPPVPEAPADIVTDVVEGSERYEMTALRDEVARAAEQLEATRAPAAPVAGAVTPAPEPAPPTVEPPAPPPELEEVAVPTEEELAEREHAGQVREVMKALTQLPRGLPTDLWNKDMAELASAIVDGPKRTAPDGTPLVQIGRRWYNADHTNVGHFLSEWKGDRPAAPSSDDERARKLDQLEERLLEGKISEETYERLRRKYEGS